MFGNKKRIKDLEAEIIDLKLALNTEKAAVSDIVHLNETLRNQVDYLIRTLRKTDDIIFSMGQSADGSWSTIRPRFQQLHDEMTARKVAESNRINSLITSELHNTYRPDEPKQIGSK